MPTYYIDTPTDSCTCVFSSLRIQRSTFTVAELEFSVTGQALGRYNRLRVKCQSKIIIAEKLEPALFRFSWEVPATSSVLPRRTRRDNRAILPCFEKGVPHLWGRGNSLLPWKTTCSRESGNNMPNAAWSRNPARSGSHWQYCLDPAQANRIKYKHLFVPDKILHRTSSSDHSPTLPG